MYVGFQKEKKYSNTPAFPLSGLSDYTSAQLTHQHLKIVCHTHTHNFKDTQSLSLTNDVGPSLKIHRSAQNLELHEECLVKPAMDRSKNTEFQGYMATFDYGKGINYEICEK